MAKVPLQAISLVCLIATSPSWAQSVSCGSNLTENGIVYDLYAYAKDCTVDEVNEQIILWDLTFSDIPASMSQRLRELEPAAPAWLEITWRFSTLAKKAPSGSITKAALISITERARESAMAVSHALRYNSIADIVPFSGAHWTINNRLIFDEVPLAGRPGLPFIDFGSSVSADCDDTTSTLCQTIFPIARSAMLTWAMAEQLAARASASVIASIKAQVDKKDDLWQRYLYKSKPMLPFDFVATDFFTGGWYKSDQYTDGFRGPPRSQWFFLHPSPGVEYLHKASDGERMKAVLNMEIVGVNRWNEEDRWINLPYLRSLSGLSLVATISDRDSVRDVGYGVLVTFSNVYSLAISSYDRDAEKIGISLSIDLANMFREKYRDRYLKHTD